MHDARPRFRPGGQRGFTIAEVLATLGVLAVSLSLVVPSLTSVTESNLRARAINELVATLHIARNEAITRNQAIVVCPSEDGENCAGVAWEAGWIRFADTDGDFRPDSGERLLGATAGLPGMRISTQTFATAVGFTASGRVSSPLKGMTGGNFTFCPANSPTEARVLALSALGHPALAASEPDGAAPECPPA